MIYDSLDALASYASIIEAAERIERVLAGQDDALAAMERIEERNAPRRFDGTLRSHKEQFLLHRVKKGREVVAVGYREQTKGVGASSDGTIVLEGAQVATVVTLQEGEFILFMPGEPYALALSGSSEYIESESVRFI